MNNKREYYFNYDFYNMESDEQLSIITNFKTRQATLDYACGPNAVLMILNYFGVYSYNERQVFDKVKCRQPGGTKIEDIVEFLKQEDFIIETSIEKERNDSGKIFDTMNDFRDFVISNLRMGYPILVESVYYGGHYQVIIGYDKRGNSYKNDVIIFADSNDSTDDYRDGYNYFSAYKFYKMWFDDRFFPKEHRIQPYILVKGKRNRK